MYSHRLLMNNPFRIKMNGEHLSFVPSGYNPVKKRQGRPKIVGRWGNSLDAQFFVGMNVDGVPTWAPKEVRDAVIKLREAQIRGILEEAGEDSSDFEGAGFEYGGSVTPMLGFWTVFGRDEEPREESVSVVIAYLQNDFENEDEFKKHMEEIGLELVDTFSQDSVLLRFISKGTVTDNIEIGWGE